MSVDDQPDLQEVRAWIRSRVESGTPRSSIVKELLSTVDYVGRTTHGSVRGVPERHATEEVEDGSVRNESGERPVPIHGEVLGERDGAADDSRGSEAHSLTNRGETDAEPTPEPDLAPEPTIRSDVIPVGSERTESEDTESQRQRSPTAESYSPFFRV